MSDNITVTPGTGVTIAADDVGGVLVQRVKPVIGGDGVAVDLTFGQGAKAASLPVVIASDDDIQAKLGIVTETAPASDTASSGLNGRLQRIAQRLTSLIALLPASLGQKTSAASLAVVIASDQTSLSVTPASSAFDVATTITRPANVTPYTAGDVVGGAITITAIGPSASAIMITGAQLELDIAAIPSGMASFRLYLYSVTPPSAVADNGTWDLVSGDLPSFLGYIDLGTPVDLGSTLYVETNNINKQLKLASANIFGYLVTSAGYTSAANSEVYKITLHTVAV
jgi:sarcosine oxidase gamma subunit